MLVLKPESATTSTRIKHNTSDLWRERYEKLQQLKASVTHFATHGSIFQPINATIIKEQLKEDNNRQVG
jgi:hypothetical protein